MYIGKDWEGLISDMNIETLINLLKTKNQQIWLIFFTKMEAFTFKH